MIFIDYSYISAKILFLFCFHVLSCRLGVLLLTARRKYVTSSYLCTSYSCSFRMGTVQDTWLLVSVWTFKNEIWGWLEVAFSTYICMYFVWRLNFHITCTYRYMYVFYRIGWWCHDFDCEISIIFITITRTPINHCCVQTTLEKNCATLICKLLITW